MNQLGFPATFYIITGKIKGSAQGKFTGRERQNSTVDTSIEQDTIKVTLTHNLDQSLYDLPLTLKTYIPDHWEKVRVSSEDSTIGDLKIQVDQTGRFIHYQIKPGADPTRLVNLN